MQDGTRRFAWLTLAVALAAVTTLGCKAADGEECTDNNDCSSSRCFDGFCAGDTCSCDHAQCRSAKSSDCEDGWVCDFSDPDAVSDFFGADGDNFCKATCGSCPPNQHCAEGASESQICEFGAPPK